MSYAQLHSNKRRRLPEPNRHSNISTESSEDFAKQPCVFSNRIQDIISSNSPAIQVSPESAAGRGGLDQAQESDTFRRDNSHCSFRSGSQPSFWQDSHDYLLSPLRPGWRGNTPGALSTHLGDLTTANKFATTTWANERPQRSSLSHISMSGSNGGGALGISDTLASFNQPPRLSNCNFPRSNYRLQAAHDLPALEAQPAISSTFFGSSTHRNSLDANSKAPQFVPAAFSDSLLKSPPFQSSLSLEGVVESSLLLSETSNIGVGEEVNETDFYDDEEEPRDLESEIICFGMFMGIAATCRSYSLANATTCAVELGSASSFIGKDDPNFVGTVSSEVTYLTNALLADVDTELQVICSIKEETIKVTNGEKRFHGPNPTMKCSLDIILYGQSNHAEDILLFIDQCNEDLDYAEKIYLQDPVGCDRNVRYCNPQRLPPLNTKDYQYTLNLGGNRQGVAEMEDLEPPPDLLDLLDYPEDLPEALQPPAIMTELKRHQKQALTFMLRREQGWAFDGTRPDIWEAEWTEDSRCFINRVSGTRHDHEPPSFYGGIIADPMGLGKTLAMITLVASDSYFMAQSEDSSLPGVLGEESCGSTLIVVPPALLGMWDEELTRHTVPRRLTWLLHHGKNRRRHISELENTKIVLTTYHTVSTEWRTEAARESSMLFATRWRRVILDEAHFIRNRDSKMAKAVCALNSVSRWAVTGTPIQNHLNDLATLLKFLSVYPYNEKRVFDADISHMWKTGHTEEAVKRLKRLAGCLLLRRPRNTVELPPRRDLVYHIELQPEERELYNQIRTQTITQIDKFLLQGSQIQGATSSFSVLQQIVGMRLVCDLGLFYPNRHDSLTMAAKRPTAEDMNQAAQGQFNLLMNEMGSVVCQRCAFTMDANYNSQEYSGRTDALFSRCAQFFCPNCVQAAARDNTRIVCGHDSSCTMASVSTSPASLDAIPISMPIEQIAGAGYIPTKVTGLIDDMQTTPNDVKCVVFSTWTMTLDVIEIGLKQAGISVLRYDGKVPQRERQKVIGRFRDDPSIRVLLLTLSCGAVGLTLTVASRAYLMEPSWNPTIEDQALARIHRMGQEKEVTTVRFYVKDSFEEAVVTNQKLKRELASILLTPGRTESSEMGHLERIRRLI